MLKKRKYVGLFYDYALSGQAKCHKCKSKIKKRQFVFVFEGNVYHDFCSNNFKNRENITGVE